VAGELCIGGDGLARGYLNRPELTAGKFIAHPFGAGPGARLYRTGDRARYRPDGNVEFLGRMDRQVKIRGFRVELEEIEAALREHPGISQCAVAAREDAGGEKQLVAYAVPADQRRAPAIAELRDLMKQKLPDYMVPGAFVMLPALPVTLNGKIDRAKLPAPDRAQATSGPGRHAVEPRTMVELQLRQIWERILGVPAVGVRDDFFALGGHSLLAVRLVGEIHKTLHRSLPLAVCFQNPTIEEMAKALGEEHRADAAPELIPLQPGGSPGNLFFLDAGAGLCRLARHLNGGPASFATYVPLTPATIRAATSGKNSELPSVEELAAAHLALVQSQRPSGPCMLAGHSFGGLLAFEVAHQLRRAGREVDLILLMDSWAMTPPWWKKLELLTLDRLRNSLLFRARYQGSRIGAKAKKEAMRLVGAFSARSAPEPDVEDANKPFGEAPWHIREKVYRHAWGKYSFRRLESRAVMFRSRDSAVAHLHVIDGKMGWGGLFAGGLEIIETPGDHMSLLTTPHVETLAARLQERLERTGRRPEVNPAIEPPTSVAVERPL
jgi:aspartate racemase